MQIYVIRLASVICFLACKAYQKGRGAYVGGQNWQTPRATGLTGWADRSDRSGPAVRVELGIIIWNPFVTQFGRGTTSPAHKYKGHGRLRSFYPIESINLHFFYFSPNPSISNLVLFFARLYGVQGRLGWPADSKTTLDLRSPTGSLPSLRF